MSKKLLNKLLSAILVLAICSATVFGCMLNVSALTYNGTYTFAGGESSQGATVASVDVTFNLDAGLAAGQFAVLNGGALATDSVEYAADIFSSCVAEVVDATAVDKNGNAVEFDPSSIEFYYSASDEEGILGYVDFWSNATQFYTELTVKLTYTFSSYKNSAGTTLDCVMVNNKYTTDIEPVLFSSRYGDQVDVTMSANNSGYYIHAHNQSWLSSIPVDFSTLANNQYGIFDATCQLCGSNHSYTQIYPDYNKITGATSTTASANGNLGISGVSVSYEDNGTIGVNVHSYSPYYSGGYYLVVCDTDGYVKYTVPNSDKTTSLFANDTLTANAHQFTITGLSASDIDEELLFTIVYLDGTTVRFSTTISFTLADYCTAVVEGDKVVYPESVSDEDKAADKAVAAALINYGAAASNIFNNPIKQILTWTGDVASEFADKSEGTADDPIIISTPEELAYLAKGADGTTAGKYYKVDDGIKAFNMNGLTGITLDSTLDDVKAATPTGNNWSKTFNNTSATAFAGSFDGNGAVVYNIYCKSWAAGLFPIINGNSEGNTTIENVTVKNSWLEAQSGANTYSAGAIFGSNLSFNDTAENSACVKCCKIENCNIVTGERTDQATRGSGAIAGGMGSESLIISDCLVAGNNVQSSESSTTKGGLVADINTNYPDKLIVENTVVLGTNPITTGGTFNANATFTNIYTDDSTVDTTTYTGITVLSDKTYAQGELAEQYMPNLAWNSVWYVGNEGEYPAFEPIVDLDIANIIPSNYLDTFNSAYNTFKTDFETKYSPDDYNGINVNTSPNCYMYASSLNLKTTPYISFTFALQGDYKADRANVSLDFAIDGVTKAAVSSCDPAAGFVVNNDGAGRYHLYRLKDLSIADMTKSITVTANYGDTFIKLGTFSVAGYAFLADEYNTLYPNEGYNYHTEAAQALLYYCETVCCRYGLQ